jgi:hypothetical protein
MRPNDYLVEMFKSDDVMQKIRNNLVKQQIKIQNFEEKKQNRENKKFARKVFFTNLIYHLAPTNQSTGKGKRKEEEFGSH